VWARSVGSAGRGPLVVYRRQVKGLVPFDQRSAYDRVNRAAQRALGKRAGCHFMRHRSLTLLEEVGATPSNIQAHARHTRLSTAETYLHADKVRGSRSAMDLLDQRRAESKTRSKKTKGPEDDVTMAN
jgi:integrase